LAHAEPVKPLPIGRSRISYDRPLPDHVVHYLSDEFSLVTIKRRSDWLSLQRRARLPETLREVDLSRGMIVGLLANVGESANDRWPVVIDSVRTRDGHGWLEATFVPGLYYPLRTAGYLELVYVPGLRSIRRVQIDKRTFIIHAQPYLH
jgi:hypothetical protein